MKNQTENFKNTLWYIKRVKVFHNKENKQRKVTKRNKEYYDETK